jgi:hypothetical protein
MAKPATSNLQCEAARFQFWWGRNFPILALFSHCRYNIAPTHNLVKTAGQIRILSVEDHPIVREGLVANIGSQEDMALVAQVNNALMMRWRDTPAPLICGELSSGCQNLWDRSGTHTHRRWLCSPEKPVKSKSCLRYAWSGPSASKRRTSRFIEIGIRGPSTALALRLRFRRDDKIWGGDSMERHAKRRERARSRFLTKRANGPHDRVLVRKPRKRR